MTNFLLTCILIVMILIYAALMLPPWYDLWPFRLLVRRAVRMSSYKAQWPTQMPTEYETGEQNDGRPRPD